MVEGSCYHTTYFPGFGGKQCIMRTPFPVRSSGAFPEIELQLYIPLLPQVLLRSNLIDREPSQNACTDHRYVTMHSIKLVTFASFLSFALAQDLGETASLWGQCGGPCIYSLITSACLIPSLTLWSRLDWTNIVSLWKWMFFLYLVVFSMFGSENDRCTCRDTYYVAHYNYRNCCASYVESMEGCESWSSEGACTCCHWKLTRAGIYVVQTGFGDSYGRNGFMYWEPRLT